MLILFFEVFEIILLDINSPLIIIYLFIISLTCFNFYLYYLTII